MDQIEGGRTPAYARLDSTIRRFSLGTNDVTSLRHNVATYPRTERPPVDLAGHPSRGDPRRSWLWSGSLRVTLVRDERGTDSKPAVYSAKNMLICRDLAGATGLEPATSGVTDHFAGPRVDDEEHGNALFMRHFRAVPERLARLSGTAPGVCCPFAARLIASRAWDRPPPYHGSSCAVIACTRDHA
jgi:hypothetical protein